MFKPLSYRRLLPDAFDLSSLALALEEVVIPQIGRLAVATFKAFDLSSLSRALDEDIAVHAARLSVAVSDAFDLSSLSLALEDVIATEVTRPAVAVTDAFDLSSLSRALDECLPTFAELRPKVKHELPSMNYHLHITRIASATRIHDNITTVAVTSSTISTRKAEKSRVIDVPVEVVDAKPVLPSEPAESAAPVRPPRIDMINLASCSKVVVEELKWRTGVVRFSSTFSKSFKRTRALSTIYPSNVSHMPGCNTKNESIPSKKPSIDKPFPVITGPPASSCNNLTSSATLNSHAPATLIVSNKRKYDALVGTSGTVVPYKKYTCGDDATRRKRKLSDAFEFFETGRQTKQHKIDFVPESPVVPTLPPVDQRSESQLISEPAQLEALPPANQHDESKQISMSARTNFLLPLDQRSESKPFKQISQISHTKSLPTKKRSHDDAFESPQVFVTKDPRKRLRKADAQLPSAATTNTTTPNQSKPSDERPVTLPQIPIPVTKSRVVEQMGSSKRKREDEPSQDRCNKGYDLISYEEFEAQADRSTPHQPDANCPMIITSLPARKRTRTADVFAEGQPLNNVDVDRFIAECCAVVVVEEPHGEDPASTGVREEADNGAEHDDDRTQEEEVGIEGAADETEVEADEEGDEDARRARYLELCREIFGDGDDSDHDED